MNNPLSSGQQSFKIISEKNRKLDEVSLIQTTKNWKLRGNTCRFPSKVFVINRSERPDRMEQFKRFNGLLYENFEVIRFEASVPNSKIKTITDAIFDSFHRCISDSPDECICIMEDDAYLADGSIEKIKKAWEDLPEDWDILIGNHYFFGSLEILNENLAKPISRASTANFIIVRKTIIPKINENVHKREIRSINDFDHFVTSELVPINNFTIWPMVSREYPSFSDHKGKQLDSSHKIRENSFKYLFIDQEKFYSSLEGW
jgi:GR25 family glycosyltransferase involved in LPS biosynthesis